ncbi:hypothetical protein [Rhodococcoides yunnanense]|uniref:hypothetical protein n=1 Tax=Rhodococcoides yunnanense TaxID=278209 RepID=UPI00093490EB|nr:hypothetical protein [Rhodococcus yunnanensis]
MGTDYRNIGEDTADPVLVSHASKATDRRDQLIRRLTVCAVVAVVLLLTAGVAVWLFMPSPR